MILSKDAARIFERICDLSLEDRVRELEQLEGEMRREVERLLAFYDEPQSRFDELKPEDLGVPKRSTRNRYGPFEIERPIGEGGMGIVYLAHRAGTEELVAVKVLRVSFGSEHLRKRFRREAEVLNLLEHPGICRFLEAGEGGSEDSPDPYIAMEYIAGDSLLEHARKHELDDMQKVELMARVCDAVHHAHQAGVIHRDLKPNNVLVLSAGPDGNRGNGGGVGHPKVLDFGVARAVGEHLATLTNTRSGAMIGTVAYMSPEQVAGENDKVAARSDIYSLGVILFELLAGRLPYPVAGLPVPVVARVIQEDEPSSLGSVIERLRGPLETVVGKALEKDPRRRYATAAALAEDLRRFARGSAVEARPPTLAYQMMRFARRHRVLTATVLGTLVALSIGMASTTWFALGKARYAEAVDRSLYRARLESAALAIRDGDAHVARTELARAPERLRGWEWHHLSSRVEDSDLVLEMEKVGEDRPLFAFDRDGKWLAALVRRGGDSTSHALLFAWELPSGNPIGAGRIDGQCALEASGPGLFALSDDRRLTEYSLPLGVKGASYPLTLSLEDGEELEVLAVDGTIALAVFAKGPPVRRSAHRIDTNTGRVRRLSDPPSFDFAARIHARAGWGATWVDAGTFHLFDLDDPSTSRVLGEGHISTAPAPNLDGTRIAWPTGDGLVSQWRISPNAPPELEHRFGRPRDGARVAAYSPSGALLATGGVGRAVHVTSANTGERIRTLGGHEKPITGLGFSWDSRWLASAGEDGSVRIFDLEREDPRVMHAGDYVYAAAFDPAGTRLVVGSTVGELFFHDARSLTRFAGIRLWEEDHIVMDLAFDPERRRVAASSLKGALVVLDLDTGETVAEFKRSYQPLSITYSPDGRRLVATSLSSDPQSGGEIVVWDAETYELLSALPFEFSGQSFVRHDPSGRWLASTGPGSSALLLDAVSLEIVARLAGHEDGVYSLAFSPDGDRLATASFDKTIRIWSVPGGDELDVLFGHTQNVYGVSWSRDGERIFSASLDQSIKVWNAEYGEEIATLLGHEDYAYSVTTHPDGETLLSTGGDGTARVWDTRSRSDVALEARRYGEVTEVLAERIEALARRPYDAARGELTSDGSLSEREREIAWQLLFGRRLALQGR